MSSISNLQAFIDPATGRMTAHETLPEKIKGRYLPQSLKYAALAAQAVLALAVMPLPLAAVALPAILSYAWRDSLRDVRLTTEIMRRQRVLEDNSLDRFDFSQPSDCARFRQKYGYINPSFVQDCKAVFDLSGLAKTPLVVMMNPRVRASNGALPPRKNAFMLGALGTLDDQGDVIMVGDGALCCLTPSQMCAVIAHETAHLAMKHIAITQRHNMQKTAGAFMTVATALAGMFVNPLLVLPVVLANLSLIGGSRYVNALQMRYTEKLCDRSAAIVTGTPQELPAAVIALRQAEKRAKDMRQQAKAALAAGWRDTPAVVATDKEPSSLHKFYRRIMATHPSDDRRVATMRDMDAAHADELPAARLRFARAFARAAPPPEKSPSLPAPAAEPAASEPQAGTLFDRIVSLPRRK